MLADKAEGPSLDLQHPHRKLGTLARQRQNLSSSLGSLAVLVRCRFSEKPSHKIKRSAIEDAQRQSLASTFLGTHVYKHTCMHRRTSEHAHTTGRGEREGERDHLVNSPVVQTHV